MQNADLIELIGKIMVQIDASHRIINVNSITTEVIGFSKKELIGQDWKDVFSITGFDGDSISNILLNSKSFDGSALTKEGRVRNIAWHKTNIYKETGEVESTICVGEDVTKHENYLFTLHKIASLLLDESETVPYREFVKLVGQAANADHTYIFLNSLNEDGSVSAKKVSEWGKNKFIDNLERLPGLKNLNVLDFAKELTDTLKSGEAINLPTTLFPNWEQSFFKQFDIRAILLIPIIVDDEFFGFVGFDNRENDREWTNSELEFLKASVKNLEQRIKRTHALSSLKASESKFRKLSGLTLEGIIIHDKGIIKDVNLAFLDLIQYSIEEIIGFDIINLCVLPEYHKVILENLKERSPAPYEVMARKKDGSIFPAEIEARSIAYDNEIIRVVAIRDITQRKRVEEELIRQKNKAEESNQLKTQFLKNMSHEIRTPLNGIVGFTQVLNDPSVSEDQRKYFTNIIQSSSDQLVRIIDDIMEISKLETNQVKVKREEVDLNAVLLELFSVFEFKAKEKNLVLHLSKGLNDQHSVIFTDKLKLQKALNNLVENAVKFTHFGRIEIGYKVDKDLQIWVDDTGIGVPEGNREVIFDRFSQVERNGPHMYGGLGLGLSIAKENTQLLGGEVFLENKTEPGSRFIIELPFEPVKRDSLNKKISKPEDPQYKVLIAEDEEVNFIFLEYLLQNMDKSIEITHVRNGKEAVEAYEDSNDYDIVLMDLKMPIMNGMDATKEILKDYKDAKIVAITAYSSQEDRKMAMGVGFIDFLTKPIQVENFTVLCKRFLFR